MYNLLFIRLLTAFLIILGFGLHVYLTPESSEALYDRVKDSFRYENEEHIRNIRQ